MNPKKPFLVLAVSMILCTPFFITFASSSNHGTSECSSSIGEISLSSNSDSTPDHFRTPAEWEQLEEVLLRWDSDLDSYYLDMTKEIANVSTAQIVTYSQSSADSIADYLESNDVEMDNVSFYIEDTDTKWMRDYGPISVSNESSGELSFVNMMYDRYDRWDDDSFPWRYGQSNSIDWYNMTDGEDWFRLEGGNLLVDGAGIFYTTDRCFEQNDPGTGGDLTEDEVIQWATDYFNLERFRHVERLTDDGHGHIDMQVKFLNETTVLVSELTDQNDEDYDILESNAQFIEESTARNGQPYDVVRIPMIKGSSGWGSTYYTHTNSLIVNDKVLVPTYGQGTDSEALEIYEDAMPDYEIVGVDSSSIISQSGAIHCTTMQVSKNNSPPQIDITDVEALAGENVSFTVEIEDDTNVSSSEFYYNTSEEENLTKVDMEYVRNGTYKTVLPPYPEGTEINYFVRAKDELGAVSYDGDAWDMHNVTVQAEVTELELNASPDRDGWNFVSLDIIPSSTDLTDLLEDDVNGVSGSYEKVMYYDTVNDRWMSYIPDRAEHFNERIEWDETKGIWIRMSVNDTLRVGGTEPENTTINLDPGWNMVGLPVSQSSNNGLPEEVTIVGYFDESKENYLAYEYDTKNFTFAPKNGYWVYNGANELINWTVEY
ncbi:MAG: agmatine deiminase family protein [Candidatus Saliniplasma sp.]